MDDCPTRRLLNVDLDVHQGPDGYWSLYVIGQKVITWRQLQVETASSMEGRDLEEVIKSEAEMWPGNLTTLLRHKDNLMVVQGVTFCPIAHCYKGTHNDVRTME